MVNRRTGRGAAYTNLEQGYQQADAEIRNMVNTALGPGVTNAGDAYDVEQIMRHAARCIIIEMQGEIDEENVRPPEEMKNEILRRASVLVERWESSSPTHGDVFEELEEIPETLPQPMYPLSAEFMPLYMAASRLLSSNVSVTHAESLTHNRRNDIRIGHMRALRDTTTNMIGNVPWQMQDAVYNVLSHTLFRANLLESETYQEQGQSPTPEIVRRDTLSRAQQILSEAASEYPSLEYRYITELFRENPEAYRQVQTVIQNTLTARESSR